MKVDVGEISSVRHTLTIEISEDDVKKEFARAYTDLRKRVRVPGFRPGKAPRALLERRYAHAVAEDVVQKLVPDYSRRAVKEAGIHPIMVEFPSIDHTAIQEDKAFSFTTTVEIEPRFEINDIVGIPLSKTTRTITTEDEEKALDTLRHRQAELHTVTEERETVKGDFVSIDIQGFVGGRPIEALTQTGVLIHLGSKSSYMGTELDPQLIARRKGDAIDVTGTYPKDPSRSALSGKPVTLAMHIREVKTAVLPELDDEFATDLGMTSLEELKKKVREGLESQLEHDTEKLYKDQLMKHLVDSHTFDVPPSLLQEEMALAVQHLEHDHQHDHGDADAAHIHQHVNEPDPEQQEKLRTLQSNIQETATMQVKARLILDAIAKEQGLKLSDDEIDTEYKRLAEQMKISLAEVKRKVYAGGDRGVQRFKARLLHQKAIQYVYAHAHIQD
ncbi:MAG TPA: trigger factor [Nitrospirales bacterium]|nr:trigger factor [Nitrospirales bacterium]